MSKYQNFIGIDIGKFNFVAALHGKKDTQSYDNNQLGIKTFLADFKQELTDSLIVLETTGGCEMSLLLTLCSKKYSVHRASTRKVKNFIRSFGNEAKTDALDSKVLALYGFERQGRLDIFKPLSPTSSSLFEWVQRRNDLTQMLVAEKNRAKAPNVSAMIKKSCEAMVLTIADQIAQITDQIKGLIAKDKNFLDRLNTLKTVPGIGDTVAQNLLALIPELGTLTRRQIASLTGLAPKANDSGKFQGYRHTAHGRDNIKPFLFLAAMAARNSHSPLKAFYENLIGRGKKKMVALTALMRKIIVIANARLKPLVSH